MEIWRRSVLFYLGGMGYCGLELLCRGRTHGSMFLAGGASLILVGQLNRTRLPFFLRAVAGAGIITAVELAAGLIFNRDYSVWDYRDQRGNFLGQICPVFSVLWIAAAAAVLVIHDPLENFLEK